MNYRNDIDLYNEDDEDDEDDELDDASNDLLIEDEYDDNLELDDKRDDGSNDFELDDYNSYPTSNSAFKERLFQRLGSSFSHPCTLYPCNCGDYVGGLGSDDACDNCGHRRHHHEGLT